MNAELRSAGDEFVMGAIEALTARYYQVETPDGVQYLLTREWLEDMEEFPANLITKACRNWRKSDKGYAPKSAGQLMASVMQEFVDMQTDCKKAKDILRLVEAA